MEYQLNNIACIARKLVINKVQMDTLNYHFKDYFAS